MNKGILRKAFLDGEIIGATVSSVNPATLCYNQEQEISFAMRQDTTSIWIKDTRGEDSGRITVSTHSLMDLFKNLMGAYHG